MAYCTFMPNGFKSRKLESIGITPKVFTERTKVNLSSKMNEMARSANLLVFRNGNEGLHNEAKTLDVIYKALLMDGIVVTENHLPLNVDDSIIELRKYLSGKNFDGNVKDSNGKTVLDSDIKKAFGMYFTKIEYVQDNGVTKTAYFFPEFSKNENDFCNIETIIKKKKLDRRSPIEKAQDMLEFARKEGNNSEEKRTIFNQNDRKRASSVLLREKHYFEGYHEAAPLGTVVDQMFREFLDNAHVENGKLVGKLTQVDPDDLSRYMYPIFSHADVAGTIIPTFQKMLDNIIDVVVENIPSLKKNGKIDNDNIRFFTDEITLFSGFGNTEQYERKAIVGTPDLIVYAKNGNDVSFMIFDFKTKRNTSSIGRMWNDSHFDSGLDKGITDADNYSAQLASYKGMLEAQYPFAKGRVIDARDILFNVGYQDISNDKDVRYTGRRTLYINKDGRMVKIRKDDVYYKLYIDYEDKVNVEGGRSAYNAGKITDVYYRLIYEQDGQQYIVQDAEGDDIIVDFSEAQGKRNFKLPTVFVDNETGKEVPMMFTINDIIKAQDEIGGDFTFFSLNDPSKYSNEPKYAKPVNVRKSRFQSLSMHKQQEIAHTFAIEFSRIIDAFKQWTNERDFMNNNDIDSDLKELIMDTMYEYEIENYNLGIRNTNEIIKLLTSETVFKTVVSWLNIESINHADDDASKMFCDIFKNENDLNRLKDLAYSKIVDLEQVSVGDISLNSVDDSLNVLAANINPQTESEIEAADAAVREAWTVMISQLSQKVVMQKEVANMLSKIPAMEYDSDSNGFVQKRNEFGIRVYEDGDSIINTLVQLVSSCTDSNQMYDKLVKMAGGKFNGEYDNPNGEFWAIKLCQIMDMNDHEAEQLKTKLWRNFRRQQTIYSSVYMENEDGVPVYKTHIINAESVDKFLMNHAKSLVINAKSFNEKSDGKNRNIDKIKKEIATAKNAKDSDDKIASVTRLLNALGITVTNDITTKIYESSRKGIAIDNVIKNAERIVAKLEKQISNNVSYNPFDKSLNSWGDKNENLSVYKEYRAIIRKIAKHSAQYIESSVYENTKTYYSFSNPSRLGKIIQNLSDDDDYDTDGNRERIRRYIDEHYDSKGWFYVDSNGQKVYLNIWLDNIYKGNSKLRYKTQLNFNKVEYRDQPELTYALSLMTEFYGNARKIKKDMATAWYSVPIISNKPVSEFVEAIMYYNGYEKSVVNGFMRVYEQEMNRIKTVYMNLANRIQAYIDAKENGTRFIDDSKEFFDVSLVGFDDDPSTGLLGQDGMTVKKLAKLRNRILDGKLTKKDVEMISATGKKGSVNGSNFKFLDNMSLTDSISADGRTTFLTLLNAFFKKGSHVNATKVDSLVRDYIKDKIEEIAEAEYKAFADTGIFATEKVIKRNSEGEKEQVEVSKYFQQYLEYYTIKSDDYGERSIEDRHRELFRRFIYNDLLAKTQLIQLSVTDLAYFGSTLNFAKRNAMVHSPGNQLDEFATWNNERVSDGKIRAIVLKDAISKSEIKANVAYALNRNKELLGDSISEYEKRLYDSMTESLLSKMDEMNLTDGQSFTAISGYRKKMVSYGEWSDAKETAYNNIKRRKIGEPISISDLSLIMQPIKPLVNTNLETMNVDGAPIDKNVTPAQYKNSEYLILIADALTRNTKLNAIMQFVESTHFNYNNGERAYKTNGIDTIHFGSTNKVGRYAEIDMSQFGENASVKNICEYLKSIVMNDDGTYNVDIVKEHAISDYTVQQNVPYHLLENDMLEGSQQRVLSFSDITPSAMFNVAGKTMNGFAIQQELKHWHAVNINNSAQDLLKELGLDDNTIDAVMSDNTLTAQEKDDKITTEFKSRLSKLLVKTVRKDQKYGADLLLSCKFENGDFVIPPCEPIQSVRIQQLIHSIVKKRINKQYVTGGSVVQVSSYGSDLSIVFQNSMTGEKLDTLKEHLEKGRNNNIATYQEYLKNNHASVMHYECYVSAPSELVEQLILENNSERMSMDEFKNAYKKKFKHDIPDDMLKLIGYRIPTEDKYSMAPLRIKGFLPKTSGESIIMPMEATFLSGSDFDIDKMYLIFKSPNVKYGYEMDRETFKKRYMSVLDKIVDAKLYDDINAILNSSYSNKLQLLSLLADIVGQEDNDIDVLMKDDNFVRRVDITKTSVREAFSEKKDSDDPNVKYTISINREFDVDDILKKFSNEIIDNDILMNITRIEYDSDPDYGGGNNRNTINNRIFDLQWAVLTGEDTVGRLLNAGNFDELKAIQKNIKQKQGIETVTGSPIRASVNVRLQHQFMAGMAMVGIFANHNVGHAVLSSLSSKRFGEDGFDEIDSNGNPVNAIEITVNFGSNDDQSNPYDNNFVFGDINTKNGEKVVLDRVKSKSGRYISKTIASCLACAVDVTKADGILSDLNINTTTANVMMLLARIGARPTDIMNFIAHPLIKYIVIQNQIVNNGGQYVSLDTTINDYIASLDDDYGNMVYGTLSANDTYTEIYDNGNTEFAGFTSDALDDALGHTDIMHPSIFDAQCLLLFKNLSKHGKHLNTLTYLTKFNSVSNAGGPNISNTMSINTKVESFRSMFDDNDNPPFSENCLDVLNDELISAFYENTVGDNGAINMICNRIFPHFTDVFQDILYTFNELYTRLNPTPKMIDKIMNFYMVYQMSTEGGLLDPQYREYFINDFPDSFRRFQEKYIEREDFPDIFKIHGFVLESKKCPIPVIDANTGGFNSTIQEQYKNSWSDAIMSDNDDYRNMAFRLMIYDLYRNGFSFSPKLATHLASVQVKQNLPGYIDSLNNLLNIDGMSNSEMEIFFDQMFRNFSNDRSFVPNIGYERSGIDSSGGEKNIELKRRIFDDMILIKQRTIDSDEIYYKYIVFNNHLYRYSGNDTTNVSYSLVEEGTLGIANNLIEAGKNQEDFTSAIGKESGLVIYDDENVETNNDEFEEQSSKVQIDPNIAAQEAIDKIYERTGMNRQSVPIRQRKAFFEGVMSQHSSKFTEQERNELKEKLGLCNG